MLTHWIVVTELCNLRASVCSATLTMVVSKMTAITPTTRISAVLTTFGSSWPAAGAGVVAMTPLSIRDELFSYGE